MLLNELKRIWSKPIEQWERSEEGFTRFCASARLNEVTLEDASKLTDLLKNYASHQDKIIVRFYEYEGADSTQLSNTMSAEKFESAHDELLDKIRSCEVDDIVSIQIEIHKKQANLSSENSFLTHIYSMSSLSNYIESLSLEELNNQFVKHFYANNINSCIFAVHEDMTYSKTDYFHFVPVSALATFIKKDSFSIKRCNDVVKIRDRQCSFANASTWPWIPDHFKFESAPHKSLRTIYEAFNALLNVSLLSFVANRTYISNSLVSYFLNGIKDLSTEHDIASLKHINADSLWQLYLWIYSSGRSSDKLGIARNIIPLYVDDVLLTDNQVLISAGSSFELSQKEDVKSYIDSTNKLAEQVFATSQKASDIAEKIANSIKTGVWTISTFVVSTLLFRIFSKGNDLTSISELFAFVGSPLFVTIIAFALFMFTCLFALAFYESCTEQKRFKEMYDASKEVYRNALTEDDIKRILSNDKHYLANDRFITKKRTFYTVIWLVILCASALILLLALNHNAGSVPEPATVTVLDQTQKLIHKSINH